MRDLVVEFGEYSRFRIQKVIGRGRRSLVRAALDANSGEKMAIKKFINIFEDVHNAVRILREIKLLRILSHPGIVGISHIILPHPATDFNDLYIVSELMDSDLHQIISVNEDLTTEHHQFFLYQLLRALKYIHTANVVHRDLTPKNILVNADCSLKIHNFGLARALINDALYWNGNKSIRWYRAPELHGSLFAKCSPKIDMWSVGCIFAEMLTRKPLFPGKNMYHQLDLITNFLGTPSLECIARVRSEKARRYLSEMKKKNPIPFSQMLPNVDPLAISLLEKLLAFDPRCRPSAEEALAHPYFVGMANMNRELSAQPISRSLFDFESKKLRKEDVRELIYREVLEYHPQALQKFRPTADLRKENQDPYDDEIAQNSSDNGSVDISYQINRENENQGNTTAWDSILEEAKELSGQFTLSSTIKESTRKLLKREKGKSIKTRFVIRNLPSEAESKFSVPSITKLLEELAQKDSGSSEPPSIAIGSRFAKRSRRKEKKSLEVAARNSIKDDAVEQVGNSTSSGEEENDVTPLMPPTMADLFQEFFPSSTEAEGFPPARPAFGYSRRLQQLTQRDKDRHSKILKQMQTKNLAGYLSGTDAEIMSRVLDAKLPVCRCFLYGSAEIERERERMVIFNQKMCGNVELEVGNHIRIYPPWKEVRINDGEKVILCTYFSQIM